MVNRGQVYWPLIHLHTLVFLKLTQSHTAIRIAPLSSALNTFNKGYWESLADQGPGRSLLQRKSGEDQASTSFEITDSR
ncbi:hypothetical protein PLEOSDRAFT_1100336 [Pleurotus ostreatus PC15]|uniref:Uncharacterized protein n=1 Tax=Pleurotus ostreatus (strain PC15) TaxID=1137138 RepID=A0A067NXX9_PLEO1|nr:hypothetical protein PLEOSDRAFT_1100336 [Pleurotus ostreatus PC15]